MASEIKMLDGGVSLRMGHGSEPIAQLTVFFDDLHPSAVLATATEIAEVSLDDLTELFRVIRKNTKTHR